MGEVDVFCMAKVVKQVPAEPDPQPLEPVYPVLPTVVFRVTCAKAKVPSREATNDSRIFFIFVQLK
jgi:hypothetical protein